MVKRLVLVVGVLVVAVATSAAQTAAVDRPLVVVSGQAEVLVAPDEVVFTLKAENVDLDVNKSKAATDNDVKKIFALARRYKVEAQNVQTDFIRINQRYSDYVQGKPRTFKGYEVAQTTTILLKDISRFEGLLSDLVAAGISDVSDVTFRASQMRKYMDEARAQAMRAAREKATALAGEIGQRIGKASNITELGTFVSPAYTEDSDRGSSNYSNSNTSNISGISPDAMRGVSDNQNTIAPGMISITVRVRVGFELN
jgi:uncharacterized protein